MVDVLSDLTLNGYFVLTGDVKKGQKPVETSNPREFRLPDMPGTKWARMRDMIQEKLELNKKRPGCEFLNLLDTNPNLYCLNPALNTVEYTKLGVILGSDMSDVANANVASFERLNIIPFEEIFNTPKYRALFDVNPNTNNTNSLTTRFETEGHSMDLYGFIYSTASGAKNLDLALRLKRYFDTNFIKSNIKGENPGSHGALFRGAAIGGYTNYDKVTNYIKNQIDYKKIERLSTYPKISEYLDQQYSDLKKLNKYVGVIASANIFFISANDEDRKFFQTDKVFSALYNDPGKLVKLPDEQFSAMIAEASRTYKDVFLECKVCDHVSHKRHEAMIKNINPNMFAENIKY